MTESNVEADREDMSSHPCYGLFHDTTLSHRSGGFGGTCERCGTLIEGDNNTPIGPITWEPVQPPHPFKPGSTERLFYDRICEMSPPVHSGWREKIAKELAALVNESVDA